MKTAFVAPLLLAIGTAAFGMAILRGARSPGRFAPLRYGETHVSGVGFPKVLENGGPLQSIEHPPRRIASLTVTADEILTRVVDRDRIAAVTRFADDPIIEIGAGRAPPHATRIRGADPEGIIALEPDLVFVAHYTLESAVRILGSASIPVVRLRETRSYRDVTANVRLLAQATGDEPRGEALVREMEANLARISGLTARLGRPRVLYYSAVGYTSGGSTLVDEKIRLAGARNAAADAGIVGFKNVALDVLSSLDPDIIVVPRWSSDAVGPVRDVRENPAFREVRAVREGRVFAVAASLLTSESPDGVKGIEELARLFHPEAFSS